MKVKIQTTGKQRIKGKIITALVLGALMSTFFACNQEFPNLIERKYGNDTAGLTTQNRKILYIIVDGARGLAVQNANIPNLSQLAKHAIYTWNGIGDYENSGQAFSNANGWANMLTSVTQSSHKIDSTFDGNDLADYPTFITRLKAVEPTWKTAAFCASNELQQNLLNNTTVSQSLGNDNNVSKATIDQLKSDDSTKVIIAEFNGVDQAGQQFGYDDTSAGYLHAISTVDGYIGDIMQALTQRKSYSQENWLVIIASNKGGEGYTSSIDLTGYGDTRRNTFVMFYNPHFQSFYAPKPQNTSGAGVYTGKAVHLFGDPTNQNVGGVYVRVQNKAGESDQSIFDVGNGSLTVEAKVKFLPRNNSYSYAYPPFLSKTDARYGTTPGWCFYRNGNTVTAYVATGSEKIEVNGGDMSNGDWHTVAMVINKEGNTYSVDLYLDGVNIGHSQSSFAAGTTVASPSPVTMGFNQTVFTDQYANLYMTDVRIWKAALPGNVISQYACYPGMLPESHPYYKDLVGFWGCTEGSGDTCKDLTGGGHDALVQTGGGASISWDPFSDLSNNICPEPSASFYRLVPNSVDIPFEIFQWLGVNIPSSWNWSGHGWVTGYTDVANPVF